MGTAISVGGYFSAPGAKPVSCKVYLSLHGYGLSENLVMEARGILRMTVPFHPVEQLALQVRREISAQKAAALERFIRLEGSVGAMHTASFHVWFRVENGFEMLTLEQQQQGQISVPYQAIQQLVRLERSTQA